MPTSREPSFRKTPLNESFAVHHWLTSNWAKIVADRPTYDQAAEMIKAELNITLAKGSLSHIVKSSGFTWPNTKKAKVVTGHKSQTARRLAGYIAILFDKLGEPRPAGLTEMLGGKAFDGEAGPLFNQPK